VKKPVSVFTGPGRCLRPALVPWRVGRKSLAACSGGNPPAAAVTGSVSAAKPRLFF